MQRVGQKPLQGFHLAPASFPGRLRNTPLQPSNGAMRLRPVDAVPVDLAAGGRTSHGHDCHSPVLLCDGSANSLARRDQPEVCSLSGGVMSDISSTPIRTITARHSLFPASHTRIPIGVPCGSLCPDGREYGLTMFRMSDSWKVRCRLSPGGGCCPCSGTGPVQRPPPRTFWFMPVSIFGMVQFTRFIIGSLAFTMLPKPSPLLRDARSFACPRGVCFTLAGSGYIVGMASNIAVASNARTPRLPPKERRVLS